MDEYWIIIDGVPKGPYAADVIRGMNLPASTPVWREGMTDWVYLQDVAELNAQQPEEVVIVVEQEGMTPPPLPADDPMPQRPAPAEPASNGRAGAKPDGEPATSYLGWSIASIILCCVPLGIVSLIYSLKVNSYNNAGDYERARKCSRTTELWLITTITLGLVLSPLVSLLQIASALG